MLDLERKVDLKFLEQKQDTSTAIVTAYDPVKQRKQMEKYVEE